MKLTTGRPATSSGETTISRLIALNGPDAVILIK
jgi:hypothetical protein